MEWEGGGACPVLLQEKTTNMLNLGVLLLNLKLHLFRYKFLFLPTHYHYKARMFTTGVSPTKKDIVYDDKKLIHWLVLFNDYSLFGCTVTVTITNN